MPSLVLIMSLNLKYTVYLLLQGELSCIGGSSLRCMYFGYFCSASDFLCSNCFFSWLVSTFPALLNESSSCFSFA